ncbi:threonine aldolase family protein [Alkalicoccus luteus]|uniref:Aminotransferase class I/II-fold pyridoxal phosphate-dependent enzyme n=1 Tax=Alkalicoccus luteus TaxID=1237094 RepID=A0A969TW22_9BACI|nr:GntG family PLP-dependent aldolase [Alkalicoccus luteus]NJP36924.1 aminotransferase class I/II-fold pyridoxal phosphate-dependent enzyme [Alkalicoccus luteus]
MIDLRSDTVTKPTETMRQLMAKAAVGDDVYEEDPTVNELEAYAAELLGKEAALFTTSGTQGNQAALLTHTVPGQEVLMDEEAHVFIYEGAAISAFAGVQSRTLPHTGGRISPELLKKSVRSDDIHYPETGLIWLENTHNRGGGTYLPEVYLKEVRKIADEAGVPVHMDGARLFNAAEASGMSAARIASYTDSVQFCLSKGLGAPVGSMLAGSASFIRTARKKRKMLGGGMRQAGVIAAPALHALKEHRALLKHDHGHARLLAKAIQSSTDLTIRHDVQTNIVVADTDTSSLSAEEWVARLEQEGIRIIQYKPEALRFTTNSDVSREEVETVCRKLAEIQ